MTFDNFVFLCVGLLTGFVIWYIQEIAHCNTIESIKRDYEYEYDMLSKKRMEDNLRHHKKIKRLIKENEDLKEGLDSSE